MSADLFNKFDPVFKARAEQPVDRADPFKVCMDEVLSETEAMIDGRHTILAGTNNYMGMTFREEAIEAAHKAIDAFGTGTTGSRVLNGTYAGHRILEDALRDFYGTEHAMVFSTGYQANLGIISTLAGKDDFVIIDADSHASIYDGCALGNATVMRFRHNDVADLDKRLGRIPPEAGKLVVIEGIYSMLGDKAPVSKIIAICKKHDAAIIVDEAHSMGFCGESGRGVAQAEGVEGDVDFIIGTFSKSVGTVGGFCVSNHPKFEVLRLVCRPYMFTASLPPSVVASAAKSIELLKYAGNRRAHLWENARRLHSGLKEAGFVLGTETAESPIIAVCLPDMPTTTRFWAELLHAGVYANMAVPPATPQGLNLLRCSVCAAHKPEQIDQIIERFIRVAEILALNLSETRRGGATAEIAAHPQAPGAAAATG